MGHVYNADFYDYIEQGSRRSAARFANLLVERLQPASLLDIGCGRGAWIEQWNKAGVGVVHGVDGAYVDQDNLLVPKESFTAHDLSRPLDLGRRFDLVQSLEVAEHIAASCSAVFVENLARHGDVILFSAAVRGQGGEDHINEQPLEYWRKLFGAHGYTPFDAIRPLVREAQEVMPWYRFNTILYANAAGRSRLPQSMQDAAVADGRRLDDGGDLNWKLRKAVVRMLPRPVVDGIAAFNARQQARQFRQQRGGA